MKAYKTNPSYTDGVENDNELAEFLIDSIRAKIENLSIRDRAYFELNLITPPIEPLEFINLNVSDIDVERRLVRIKTSRGTFYYAISKKGSVLLEQMIDPMAKGHNPLFANEFGERLSLYQFWLIKREIWIDIILHVYGEIG
ncbi:MAG: hypothetical protein APF81_09030 [Desulfosporosinus sp. BRH_c37]|nr:MAG: hypothetical protein APF81_09030 [Desulfosporosinus sp. BRH_c37]